MIDFVGILTLSSFASSLSNRLRFRSRYENIFITFEISTQGTYILVGGQLSENSFNSAIPIYNLALSVLQLLVVVLVSSLPQVFHPFVHYGGWVAARRTSKDFPKTQQHVSIHLSPTTAHPAPNIHDTAKWYGVVDAPSPIEKIDVCTYTSSSVVIL